MPANVSTPSGDSLTPPMIFSVASFHGVNTLTMADIKLALGSHQVLVRKRCVQSALVSRCEPAPKHTNFGLAR